MNISREGTGGGGMEILIGEGVEGTVRTCIVSRLERWGKENGQ